MINYQMNRVITALQTVLEEYFDIDLSINDKSITFEELGFDHIMLAELIVRLEDEIYRSHSHEVKINLNKVYEIKTIHDLEEEVSSKLGGQ